jgi:hypothetical protein
VLIVGAWRSRQSSLWSMRAMGTPCLPPDIAISSAFFEG